MRRNIASLAARIMAEDGIADYGFAKRKAARQLGAPDSEALPTNAEIESELRTYQALYQEEEHTDRLRELRETAVQVMELLRQFNPYLTGPVLDGTAGRYAEVSIDLFADSAKDVEIFLLNRNMPFEPVDPRRTPDSAEAALRLEWGHAAVVLTVFPPAAQRSARRGAPADRARIDAVRALLGENQ